MEYKAKGGECLAACPSHSHVFKDTSREYRKPALVLTAGTTSFLLHLLCFSSHLFPSQQVSATHNLWQDFIQKNIFTIWSFLKLI